MAITNIIAVGVFAAQNMIAQRLFFINHRICAILLLFHKINLARRYCTNKTPSKTEIKTFYFHKIDNNFLPSTKK